jgi:hypothetical protein
MARRWLVLVAAAWLGLLLAVAAIATPAPFAVLPRSDAGRVVAQVLAYEAWISLVAAVLCMWLVPAGRLRGLPAAAALLTLIGYFGVMQLMPAARAGQGALSFAQLHLFSTTCYALKAAAVAALAWRASAAQISRGPSS